MLTPNSTDHMNDQLSELCREIRACKICVEEPKNTPLPHSPRPVLQVSANARICICGQAPGTRVHNTGLPFNDPSGDRLREWMGLDRERFYNPEILAIIPMGFCFPGTDKNGGDLPPRTECKIAWHDSLFKLLPRLELIVAIGQYAHDYHLGKKRGKTVTETVKRWRDYWDQESSDGVRYLPLPHPSWRNTAWLNNNQWFSEKVLPVLKNEVIRLTD